MGMNLQKILYKKQSLRKIAIEERKLINTLNRSDFEHKLANMSHDYLKDGAIIAGYYPINHELNIIPLLKKLSSIGHKVLLPCITKSKILDFREWEMNKKLPKNFYSIPEPNNELLYTPDIVYVPALQYGKGLHRLGYGGGFYDQTINYYRKNFSTKFIGVCFPNQIKNNIPHEKYDQKVDFIIDLGEKQSIG